MEDALTSDVTNLLLEMGTGFAFMGRQKEIIVGGRSRKIDLLFYHVRLRCYIACEIKVKPFEPEFTGKLNYYVSAVDELVKAPDDNPQMTIEQALATVTYIAQETEVSGFRFSICRLDCVVL